MPRPPVKKTQRLAEATALGTEIGRIKARKKVKIQDILRDKLIDVIDRIDPMKLAATVALAYVYKVTLDGSQEWVSAFTNVDVNFPLTKRLIDLLAPLTGYTVPEGASLVDLSLPDTFEWLLCFAFAYITIEHGAELAGGIVGFAKGVLPK